ncbi:ABC transporter permease [Bacteroidota bacterium]
MVQQSKVKMMKDKKPGILAEHFLYLISSFGEEFAVMGDFEEMYKEKYNERGLIYAKLWCWKQIIFSFPLFIKNKIYWGFAMFNNYFKIAVRNLRRHKSFSIINISGLAIGLAVSLLILLYVFNEVTYDKHIENYQNKFRIGSNMSFQGRTMKFGQTAAPTGQVMFEEIPEVINSVRLYMSEGILTYEDKIFKEEDIVYAEPTFFDMFTVNIIIGNPESVLEAPFSIILTEDAALKYFGSENPIGKILKLDNSYDFTVTGIVDRLPANTHIQYDMLASWSSLYQIPYHQRFIDGWMGFNYKAYVEITDASQAAVVQTKLDELVVKYTGELARMFGAELNMFIQPIGDIYLYSDLEEEKIKGNLTYIMIFTAIAFFIILIACINFMNLSTARSLSRLKEIGMRKVLGAERKKIINQFLSESILLSVIGFAIALFLLIILLPTFNRLIDKQLELSLLFNWEVIIGLVVLTLLVGLIAGSYPALYTSRFQPVNALQGKLKSVKGSVLFRNSLVTFQFIVSIGLICITLVIYTQLKFISERNLGFDKDEILCVSMSGQNMSDNYEIFKQRILQIPGVETATATSLVPGRGNSETYFKFEGVTENGEQILPFLEADYDFAKTLGINTKIGRWFNKEFPADETAMIINETLLKSLGWDDPIGKKIERMEMVDDKPYYREFRVIGVINDYHFTSLHQKIRPLVITLPVKFSEITGDVGYVSAKVGTTGIQNVIAYVEKIWKEMEPARPINYFFLDESFGRLYRAEQRLGEMFIYFTILAIFVSCLGLFGLATFTAEKRTKEVGIRKTLGADTSTIVVLLAKDFAKWVLLANIVAWPVAYYAINKWLESFAYKIDVNFLPFILAGAIAFAIALVTISYQTIKVSSTNPANTLRTE